MSTLSLTQHPSTAPILSPALVQGLQILQMPVLELASWLHKQLEENPLVELLYDSSPPTDSRVIETGRIVEQRDFSNKEKTLTEHIESQARIFFTHSEDLQTALEIISNLDQRGFLPKETPDSRILESLKLFDPPGVFARSLQESLLIQLKGKGRAESLAYRVIDRNFDDLLNGRFAKICKSLNCTKPDLHEALHTDIASLAFNPGCRFSGKETHLLIPDLLLREEEGSWSIEINKSNLPRVRLNHKLLQTTSQEAKDYLHSCYKEARRLILSVRKRGLTLSKIGNFLLKTQIGFLDGMTLKPTPLTIQEVAEELKLHPATIARAIAGKYVSCAHHGILPLNFFFSSSLGETIAGIIARETKPLSDRDIAERLRIPRRTVAKYRVRHKIPSASIRKNRKKKSLSSATLPL